LRFGRSVRNRLAPIAEKKTDEKSEPSASSFVEVLYRFHRQALLRCCFYGQSHVGKHVALVGASAGFVQGMLASVPPPPTAMKTVAGPTTIVKRLKTVESQPQVCFLAKCETTQVGSSYMN
jgi:hypothetical protein